MKTYTPGLRQFGLEKKYSLSELIPSKFSKNTIHLSITPAVGYTPRPAQKQVQPQPYDLRCYNL